MNHILKKSKLRTFIEKIDHVSYKHVNRNLKVQIKLVSRNCLQSLLIIISMAIIGNSKLLFLPRKISKIV